MLPLKESGLDYCQRIRGFVLAMNFPNANLLKIFHIPVTI